MLLRWNPSAVLEANRCVSSGVYVFSRKRWTNAGGYAPAKPQSGLEKEYTLWGRVEEEKTTQCTTTDTTPGTGGSCLRKCEGVRVRVCGLEGSQQNGSSKEPVITIEGWKLNPYTAWHGQQSQQQSNPGRGSPTSKAHAHAQLHLHPQCYSPPPRAPLWQASLTGFNVDQRPTYISISTVKLGCGEQLLPCKPCKLVGYLIDRRPASIFSCLGLGPRIVYFTYPLGRHMVYSQ